MLRAPKVRVLICDDQTVVREGLEAILSTDSDIEVVGTAANGAEAIERAGETQPDVVLMDLKMPVLNGVLATQRLRERQPEVRVLVLTTYADDQWVLDAIRAGATGYLLKDIRRDDLVAAIKGTAAGQSFLDPSVAGKVMSRAVNTRSGAASHASGDAFEATAASLTEREVAILRLVARGHNNPEIAQRLHLAPGTVRNYVSSILQKLGVEDRTQAAVVAYQRGLIDSR
jgi:DNA-binding NarL/FixJ family response regulator